MKTRINNLGNSCYKLVIDQPGINNSEKPVLAIATHYFSCGCWGIEDVRLAEHQKPDQWFSIGADDRKAYLETSSEKDSEYVRSRIKDYIEYPNDQDGSDFEWCTFNGLVPGRPSKEVSRSGIVITKNFPLFHTRKDALDILKEIAQYWDQVPLDEADPDIVNKAGKVKIENANLQVDAHILRFDIRMMAREKDQPRERQN